MTSVPPSGSRRQLPRGPQPAIERQAPLLEAYYAALMQADPGTDRGRFADAFAALAHEPAIATWLTGREPTPPANVRQAIRAFRDTWPLPPTDRTLDDIVFSLWQGRGSATPAFRVAPRGIWAGIVRGLTARELDTTIRPPALPSFQYDIEGGATALNEHIKRLQQELAKDIRKQAKALNNRAREQYGIAPAAAHERRPHHQGHVARALVQRLIQHRSWPEIARRMQLQGWNAEADAVDNAAKGFASKIGIALPTVDDAEQDPHFDQHDFRPHSGRGD